MLFFLRQIRRKLISTDNKVLTYLLYAVGEILLVVVGILIAVNIEDWNEQRKNRELYIAILKEVQKDLLIDVQHIDGTFTEVKNKILQIDHIIRTNPDATEYRADKSLAKVILRFGRPINLDGQAYKKLNQHETPTEFKDLQERINLLITRSKYFVDMAGESVMDIIVEHKDFLMKNTTWFSDVRAYNDDWPLNEEFINYLVEDPIYRNKLTYVGTERLMFLVSNLLGYQLEAVSIYQSINVAVGANPITDPEMSKYFRLDQPAKASLAGLYAHQDDTIQVSIQDGRLYIVDSENTGETLAMLSDNRFRNTFFDVEFDSLGTSLIIYYHVIVEPNSMKEKFNRLP